MQLSPRVARIGTECVACGCCATICPRDAIRIRSGVIAELNETLCVGCGRCAKECPAAVITIVERRSAQ
ncbi:MAG: 4Fe-4S binding protein [Candidatus Merdivicinus sp.]|jgi:Pyruvate/2-oxoacid:ferredoxin oxidoreductase delta subunit